MRLKRAESNSHGLNRTFITLLGGMEGLVIPFSIRSVILLKDMLYTVVKEYPKKITKIILKMSI